MHLRRNIQLLIAGLLLFSVGLYAQATQDIGWPRQIVKSGATLVYYQPQIDSWDNYKTIKARVAFSLTPANGKATLGVASFEGDTLVDQETRTVFFRNIRITSVRFPSLQASEVPGMEQTFRELAPTVTNPISVDRVLADLNKGKVAAKPVQLKNDPPQIFYSSKPAVLLIVDGDPVLAPVEHTDLQYVVNTNWNLFFDKKTKTYYLLASNVWLSSPQYQGDWTPVKKLPADFSKLPDDQHFDDVKKAVPPPAHGVAPQVFFSAQPAELIMLKGAPVYSRIAGTSLLYVTNTDNDLFVDDTDKQFYVLLSGRWFSAKALGGPWSYAGDHLPQDFAKIPENSTKSHVLASVPGTVEASDAVMLAQIPTTAIVNKAEAEAKVKVTYDGTPVFKSIETTTLEYATNTQEKVIKYGDTYYLCFQAVWFVSSSPNGPWKVADSVPSVIYSIPPSSPVYNITYVTQTNPTATTVESSTTAGYFGMFVIGAAVGAAIVYGTGWYYPPYFYWGPMYPYPIYRPWPCTYGAGYAYNPWTGGFIGGRAVYGPYAMAGSTAWFNPATGRYGRSATVQGWYGGRTVASAYNPWTGGYGATSQGHNAYAQWGQSVAVRGDQWIHTGHVTTAAGTAVGYRTSNGQSGVITRGPNGNTVMKNDNGIYAGHDGNIYHRDTNGNWSEYVKGGGWNPVQPQNNNLSGQTQNKNLSGQTRNSNLSGQTLNRGSSGGPQGLDRDAAARRRGQIQTQRFQNFHRFNGGRMGGLRGRR